MATTARTRLAAGALALCCVLGGGASAEAHPRVDEAIRHVEHAEFDAALSILERLEREGALARKDVLDVLEQGALVRIALGRRPEAERSLRLLAILSPEHRFPPNTSPDLVTAFELARRSAPPPPRLVLARSPAAGGERFEARVEGDPGKLVRRVSVWVRINSTPVRTMPERSPVVALAPGDRVEWGAIAEGDLGVLVETEPQRFDVPAKRASGVSPWWYAGGAAVVAVAAVVSVVLLSSGTDRTQPGRPAIEGR